MKKRVLEKALERKYEIKPGHLFRVGRYTIVRIEDEAGNEGVGIARCSDEDKYNRTRSYNIALCRAKKAVELKRSKLPVKKLLMG